LDISAVTYSEPNDMTSASKDGSLICPSSINAFIMRALTAQGLFKMDRGRETESGWRVLDYKTVIEPKTTS